MSHFQRLDQLFSTGGDGTGTTNMATTAAAYYLTPPDNTIYDIFRLNVVMQDSGKWRGDYYTAAGSLASGIVITHENAGGVIHTFNPLPIKSIGHWSLLSGIDVFPTNFTVGNDLFYIRWTLARGTGDPYTVDGREGEFIKINVQDSLAALVEHYIQAQGVMYWSE